MFGRSAKSMDEFDKNKKLLGEYDLIDDDLEKELCDLERKPRTKVMNRPVTDTHREWRGDNMCSKDLAIPNPRSPQEALEQRLSKYRSGVESALKEGNGNKERRMGRIVKQYEDALKALKAGEAVDFSQLPNPPGYPPIPVGVSSKTPPLPVPVQESAGAVSITKPKEPVGAMAQEHGRSRPVEEHGSYGRAEGKVEVDHSVPQSKNLLEAQRHEKCRTDVDSCKAEGNGSNAQRMERTVEKKKDAVKLVKAGRKEIDGDQDLCEIFRDLATSTKDANELKNYLIQCISKMSENTLSVGVRMIAEKLEASPKVAEEETDERALSEGAGIKPVQPVEASEQIALSGGDVWRDSVDAEQVLGHFQDQFLKEMNATAIVHQHEEDQDIISSPDTMKIRERSVWTEPSEALYDHFKQTCTKAMRGHPKEGALGADMKSMLEEPVFPSEPLLKGFTHVTEQNEPPVDEHAIQDSPPSSDDLGETQDGDSLPQYQPKTLPVAPPPTPPTTPPHNEEEECDELAVAEEDSSEEPLLSNDASSLKFSEQLTEETPQPHTPGGSGPVEEGEQLTEETPQLNKAVEERGPQGDVEDIDDEQVMTEKEGSKAKDRIGGVDSHINVCYGMRSCPLHERIRIGSAVCRIAQGKRMVGSGSIVTYIGKFYFLTAGHILLTRKKGGQLEYLSDDDVQIMKENCKLVDYHFSDKYFMITVAVPAAVVLKNYEDPKLVFDKLRDLLAIEVNDPAGFSARLEEDKADALHPIHPIPLQPSVIADCLKDDVWLMIAQFPWEEIDKDNDHRAECLEIACGLKRIVNVHQDTLVTYMLDTYHGSSGAPVLLATEDGKLELVAVHRKFSRKRGVCKIGSIPNEDFLSRL